MAIVVGRGPSGQPWRDLPRGPRHSRPIRSLDDELSRSHQKGEGGRCRHDGEDGERKQFIVDEHSDNFIQEQGQKPIGRPR